MANLTTDQAAHLANVVGCYLASNQLNMTQLGAKAFVAPSAIGALLNHHGTKNIGRNLGNRLALAMGTTLDAILPAEPEIVAELAPEPPTRVKLTSDQKLFVVQSIIDRLDYAERQAVAVYIQETGK